MTQYKHLYWVTIYSYKLPRLKAIRTIIAGPEVRIKKSEANCATVVKLGMLRTSVISVIRLLKFTYFVELISRLLL